MKRNNEQLMAQLTEAKGNVTLGLHQHSKSGDLYDVLGVVMSERTHEVQVRYLAKKTGIEWIRPLSEFYDIVDIENGVAPRYAPLVEDVKTT